jgi:hypothetical protein
MREERSWRIELKWWLSAFVALMAALMIVAPIAATLAVTSASPADLDKAGVTDKYAAAQLVTVQWPQLAVRAFYPFLFAAAFGFRLLVPTFAGAPPKAVAAVVMGWPIMLGTMLISNQLLSIVFFVALALVWAVIMPMPRKTILAGNPILGGALIGLALGAFTLSDSMLLAILWCVWRLSKRHDLEAAATAAFASIVPMWVIATDISALSRGGQSLYIAAEIAILLGIALIGAALSRVPPRAPDDDLEGSWEDDKSTVEASAP